MLDAKNIVKVDLGVRSYDIAIAPGLLDQLATTMRSLLSQNQLPTSVFLISDSNVAPLYAQRVAEQFSQLGLVREVVTLQVPAGERSKSVSQISQLWDQLISSGADRSSHIVALGGGVIGDLAGFAAASYSRGIRFIQIPTSLLAQVDSSVGGKVGINLESGKNMVGAFWQPSVVLIDPRTLTTLSRRELRSGMAEVVKYGVIMDEPFFEFLESHSREIMELDDAAITRVIRRCCELKAEVVIADETEQSGRRAILNYGHTFGHAIEKVFGYGHYTHGEAISIGMHCAAKLSCDLGRVEAQMVDRQAKLLQQFGLPLELEEVSEELVDRLLVAMRSDKKVSGGKLKMILADAIGAVSVCPAPDETLIRKSFY